MSDFITALKQRNLKKIKFIILSENCKIIEYCAVQLTNDNNESREPRKFLLFMRKHTFKHIIWKYMKNRVKIIVLKRLDKSLLGKIRCN